MCEYGCVCVSLYGGGAHTYMSICFVLCTNVVVVGFLIFFLVL